MKRPSQRAIIIAYLAMTTAIAPVAFRIGFTNSANQTPPVSQNDTDSGTNSTSRFIASFGGDDCGLLGFPGTIRTPGIEIDCLAPRKDRLHASFPRKVIAGLAQNRRRTPLDNDFASAIVTSATGNPTSRDSQTGQLSSPLSMAMALAVDAEGSGSLGGPTTPSNDGLPYIFAPVIGINTQDDDKQTPPPGPETDSGPEKSPAPTSPPEPDDGPMNHPNHPPGPEIPDIFDHPGSDDTPELVTPIPAALPLLLTGFAGLMAATRRKRQKSRLS